MRRSHYIALTAVILFVIVLLALPGKTTGQFKLALSAFFLPLFGLAGTAHDATERAGKSLIPRQTLVTQLDQIRRENQLLRLQVAQSEEARRENDQLRRQLGFQKQSPWKLRAARVIGGDTANWWRTIKIDFGRQDGAQLFMPVLTADGLVGRISELGMNYAQIALVGDPNCRVAAFVVETRENGIVGPSSSSALDRTFVEMILPQSSDLKIGHRVITSGQGGVFPKGILVGEILDFRNVSYGLYQEARVKLAVNANRLQEVFVKLPE